MAVLAKKEHSLAKSMHSTGTHWDWDVSFLRSMEYGIYSVLFVGQTCRTPIKNSYFEDISGYPPRILFFGDLGYIIRSGWWFQTFFISIIYGMSSFPLTIVFSIWSKTADQYWIMVY